MALGRRGKQVPLDLGVPLRTGELAMVLGIRPLQLHRLADQFGWNKHPGTGRWLWWSEEEQRQLRLVKRMMDGGIEAESAVQYASVIPAWWTRGWAAIWHGSYTVSLVTELDELVPLEELVTLIPLGLRGIVDVDTGGRV